MEYSFCQEEKSTHSRKTSSNCSFQSFLVEHDHFESYVIDPKDFYQQMSLNFYGKRARSYSPRNLRNLHVASEKIGERPGTPSKRLRKYPKAEEFNAINNILNNINKKKVQKNDFFLPKIMNLPPKNSETGGNSNELKNISNYKNNFNVKINFFLNDGSKENEKARNEFQYTNAYVYRSKSPETVRNQIFINSSKNALQNLNYNEPIKEDKYESLKTYKYQLTQEQIRLANNMAVKKVNVPRNTPPLYPSTKKFLDNYIDSKYKLEELVEKTPHFKNQNFF